MKIERIDKELLDSLGFGGNKGRSWRVLARNGHILLILPDDDDAIRIGLGLYRPQRFLARVIVRAVVGLPKGRFLLKKMSADLGPEGIVQDILGQTGAKLSGLLLGNPSQKERRVILLLESKRGDPLIVKLGTSPAAIKHILTEKVFLEDYGGALTGIPSLVGSWEGSGWQAFGIDYCDGSGDLSETQICKILRSWCSLSDLILLRQIPDWCEMQASISDQGEREWIEGESRDLRIRQSLRHGDFTPWNVLVAQDAQPMVIDWETGRVESVSGWDLVHYLYLSATLVDRLSSGDALSRVQEVLEGEGCFSGFLDYLGWGGKVPLLLKSYFYSMGQDLENFEKLAKSVRTV